MIPTLVALAFVVGFVLGRATDRSYYAGFRHAHALCHRTRCSPYGCRAEMIVREEDPRG